MVRTQDRGKAEYPLRICVCHFENGQSRTSISLKIQTFLTSNAKIREKLFDHVSRSSSASFSAAGNAWGLNLRTDRRFMRSPSRLDCELNADPAPGTMAKVRCNKWRCQR